MNSATDRFRHDRSPYERPSLGWRCGRAAGWGTPCKRGPTAGGTCGGENACAPARTGNSWQCRRTAAEGGPCPNGPGQDGSCGLRQPPCVPRRTFAVWRRRLSVLAVGALVALVVLLTHRVHVASTTLSSLNP